jgi:serine phosphatase RsbU (regulator of sigma subunit)
MKRPGGGGRGPRKTPGAGRRAPRKTPGSGSAKVRRGSDPARPASSSASISSAAMKPAPRVTSTRTGGSVAGRRVQGLGLSMKLSLTIAGLVVAIELALMTYVSMVLRENLENAIKRGGAQTALALAERGKIDTAAYQARNTQVTWAVRDISNLRIFVPRGGRPHFNDVEEALILHGDTLVSSAAPDRPPVAIKTTPEPIEKRYYDNVECLRGFFVRKEGGSTKRIEVLQFKTSWDVAGASVPGTARVLIAIDRIDGYINTLIVSAVIAGIVFVLFGVAVSYFLASGIVRPVRRLMRDMDIVSRGDFDHVTKRTSSDEIGLLAMAFNDMTKSLKVAQELELEQEKVQAELDTAREIQAHLLPAKIPQLPGFDIYQAYSPAKDVGGDYFDFIPVDRENLGVVCADVSGKGIPGSMVMSSTRTVLRMLATGNTSASDTLAQTNTIVARDIKRGMFVTAIYGVLNVRQKTFTVASAGHNPMVLFRARSGKHELVNPAGIALGFDKGPIFNRTVKEQAIQLYKGDRVVLYTDGVVEAMNEKHDEYGDERFYRWVQANARAKSRDFVRALLRELENHRGRAEQHDDITIVTIRVE